MANGDEMLRFERGLSNIPPAYRHAVPAFELAARLFEGTDLHIVGDVGTSKSTMACAILKGAVELRPDASVGYINAYDFEWTRLCDPSIQPQLEELFDVDVLVVDGIDIGLCSYDGYEVLYRVLNRRYPASRHTVTTSFYDVDNLASRIARRCGDDLARAISNRIDELSEVVRLHGPDRRLQH